MRGYGIFLLLIEANWYTNIVVIFSKADNFGDFLYGGTLKKGFKLLKERICSHRSKFFSLRVEFP